MALIDSVLFRTGSLILQSVASHRARLILRGFRPEVVCVCVRGASVDSADPDVLIVRPSADPTIWIFPQEGIEGDESIESATKRCLRVELGIEEQLAHFRRSVWVRERILPTERQNERDVEGRARSWIGLKPMIGKAYFAARVHVSAEDLSECRSAEILEAKWAKKSELEAFFSENVPEKREILRLCSQLI